jgi:histidyl-tRNA synthetase
MADKPNRLDPRLPRGFADRGPADIRAVEAMMQKIKAVYERYGFEPVETPFVEYTEALGKFLPDQDRPNEGVFSFQDEDEAWLSLRYDLTAPLARYVAANYDALPKPYRSYRAGWVFRNEKPGPGRFRQFMQFDADTVGASSPAADAEICMMAADVMEELFGRGKYVIKVSSRKVLDTVMDTIGIASPEQRLRALRAVDKRDRVGESGVRLLLGEGRKDESGDFTAGAGLKPEQIDKLLAFLGIRETGENLYKAVRELFGLESPIAAAVYDEYVLLSNLCEVGGYKTDRVQIDPSVVRGLEYYTGPVFEAQLTFEVPNEKGEPVVFGSVGGGGRYDGLVGRFRGPSTSSGQAQDVPATGFSVGVSRLASALKAIGKLGDEGARGPVVVTVMDKAHLRDYQRLTVMLREGLNRDRPAGDPIVPVEMYVGDLKKLGNQLKYADRRNSPIAIIAGSNEFGAGTVQIKDLIAGKKKAAAIANNKEWREERSGQETVAEAILVAKVKELLEKQRQQADSDSDGLDNWL